MSFRYRSVVAALLAFAGLAAVGACGNSVARVNEPQIDVTPTEISFSQVILGDQDTQSVTIHNLGSAPLVITGLRVEANTTDLKPGFDFPGRMEVAPNDQITVDIVWAPTEVVQASGELIIISNDKDQGEFHVPIATPPLAPAISVTPQVIDFGFVPEASENTINVTLTNRGTAPLVISQMFVTGSPDFTAPDLDGLQFPYTLDVFHQDDPNRQPTFQFDVTYAPPTPGSDTGIINIDYNSLDGTNFQVDLKGEAGLPALTVSPNPIDFGQRPLGLPSRQTVTITNTGMVPLAIDQIELSPETSDTFSLVGLRQELTVPDGSVSLPADNTLPFIVEFTPPSEAAYGGQVLISYHQGEDPPGTGLEIVDLLGVGVDNRCPVAVARGFIRDDPQQRRSQQIDWATPTDILILDGSGSFDPDGQIVAYDWEMTRAPDGTTTLLRPLDGFPDDDSRRQFFVPLSGRYEFTLHVTDNVGFQDCDDPATVTVLSLPDEAIHIELTWHNPLDPDETDDQGSDVDLHLVKLGHNWFDQTYDCYYANKEPDWNPELPSLDIDDTDGGGPENIQMDNPVDCQWYAIGVHYFQKQFGTAYATIRLYINSEEVAEFVNRPLENTDDFWDVGRLQWPTGEFFPVDQIYQNFDHSSATPPQITPDMQAAVAGGVCQ